MMRAYLAAWGDRECLCGVACWLRGMNPGARYEALTMYDQRDTNGTEICAPWPATSCSPPAPTNLPAATPQGISTCQ